MHSSRFNAFRASLLLLGVATIGAGCTLVTKMSMGGPEFDAKGPQTEDKRTVDTFDKIDVGSAFQTDVRIGSPASVTLDVPKDLLPHIKTTVSGGTLNIESDVSFNLQNGAKLRAHIVVPSLTGATVSGAASMKVDGAVTGSELNVEASGAATFECSAKSDQIDVQASGAARVTLSELAVKSLTANASGASTCVFQGSADETSVEASGASTITASSLTVKNAKVQASGGSNASVKADETLSAEATGGSSVHYSGSAKVTKDASGGSEVTEGE